jgi:hypothetical protein
MKWTSELLKEELIKSIKVLGIDRMPTGQELKSIGRNDLHCKISRTKKYSGWAEELGLGLKSGSTTREGQEHEKKVMHLLEGLGYEVEQMAHKFPYDLLVNGCVKIDVKMANAYLLRGESRVHTFGINKEKPTSDILICLANDEEGNVERMFIIPSHHVQMKMLNVGANSKYNKYVDKFEYIKQYSDFYKTI